MNELLKEAKEFIRKFFAEQKIDVEVYEFKHAIEVTILIKDNEGEIEEEIPFMLILEIPRVLIFNLDAYSLRLPYHSLINELKFFLSLIWANYKDIILR